VIRPVPPAGGDAHPGTVEWPSVIGTLLAGQDLDAATAEAAMRVIMAGEAGDAHIAAFLTALRAKGETVGELAGLARTMRAFAEPVPVDGPLVDTCGTGGSRTETFNVSTVAAVIAAAAGARVAKHGNRAASGRCGSADLLEAWGVAIDLPGEAVAACVDELGIGFCFAPTYHPAMRHVMPVRTALGVPTAFNLLGPLSNPAGAAHQTVGVADPAVAETVAGVLAQLEARHALVFHGAGGLDELTTAGVSPVWRVRDGRVGHEQLDPGALGLVASDVGELRGGDVAASAAVAEAVLADQRGPARDVAVLSAAAALIAADLDGDWPAALARADDAVSSGAAATLRDQWVARSRELAAAPR
jgi:anthranilate phosphoribosyltransferase